MKIVVSPAKSLDFESKALTSLHTQPAFLNSSEQLNTRLRQLSAKDISKLMKISDDLGRLNNQRNEDWQVPFTVENAKQAVYSFTGDVYKGLEIATLSKEKIPLLQNTLRILSGLYGILKPLDLIQPYRLEMGTKLTVDSYKNLYEFWGNQITEYLNNEMEDDELFINLASNEYFKVIKQKELKVPIITPVFKELKGDQYKIVAFYAKKARGLMARYIIDNNCKTIEDIKGFNIDNYRFTENLSSETELVFTR